MEASILSSVSNNSVFCNLCVEMEIFGDTSVSESELEDLLYLESVLLDLSFNDPELITSAGEI
jgi:hypothetical protein